MQFSLEEEGGRNHMWMYGRACVLASETKLNLTISTFVLYFSKSSFSLVHACYNCITSLSQPHAFVCSPHEGGGEARSPLSPFFSEPLPCHCHSWCFLSFARCQEVAPIFSNCVTGVRGGSCACCKGSNGERGAASLQLSF